LENKSDSGLFFFDLDAQKQKTLPEEGHFVSLFIRHYAYLDHTHFLAATCTAKLFVHSFGGQCYESKVAGRPSLGKQHWGHSNKKNVGEYSYHCKKNQIHLPILIK